MVALTEDVRACLREAGKPVMIQEIYEYVRTHNPEVATLQNHYDAQWRKEVRRTLVSLLKQEKVYRIKKSIYIWTENLQRNVNNSE